MKVRVRVTIQGRSIDETITGRNAAAVLVAAKERVAQDLGWKGMMVRAMSPLQFAQTAARMYNESHQSSFSIPESADEFIAFGVRTGDLEVLDA